MTFDGTCGRRAVSWHVHLSMRKHGQVTHDRPEEVDVVRLMFWLRPLRITIELVVKRGCLRVELGYLRVSQGRCHDSGGFKSYQVAHKTLMVG